MILKFLNASLKRRVLLMFMVIGMMIIIDVFMIINCQNKLDQHSKTLSIIYQNKSSIDKLSTTANKIFRENEFDVKDELLLKSSQISKNIALLIKGGKVPGTNLSISPSSGDMLTEAKIINKNWDQAVLLLNIIHNTPLKVDSTIKELMVKTEMVDSTYQDISYEIDRVILVSNSKIKSALSQLSSYKKLLFEELNQLATSVLNNYENQRSQYNATLWIILLINLIIIGLFSFLIINIVIRPLKKIGYLATKVANGDEVDIKYKKNDEISEIVDSVKSLGNHLRQASNFVHHIGEGNLDIALEGLEQEKQKTGSLAHALISMQNKLKLISQEDQVRNWATRGMANFAEILRNNNNNLQSLGDAILAELISYTDANISCMYVPDESKESKTLQLIAFYAYDTKKHFNETVMIGEGLIGQTFIEKKTTYLLEVPDDYTKIKSGVGESSPKSILVIPLKVNEQVYGVLEIASFKEFTQEQIDFIEKIGETIATTIHNVKNAEQTKKLLEDSQQLTEQMRAQEEEMHQNMEELSATQEEIARKEIHSASTIEAFENAVATVEFNESGIISDTNAIFTTLSNQSKESLVGKHLSVVLETFENQSIQPLIDKIFQDNLTIHEDLKLISEVGESTNLSGHFSYLQSGDALLVCFQKNDTVPPAHVPITDLEEELTQNLNMLEVTQQSLDEKAQLMKDSLLYLEINPEDEVIFCSSGMASTLFDKEMNLVGKIYTDLLLVSDFDIKEILHQIDENGRYQGVVSIDDEINSKKIMLHIERTKK